MTPADSPPPPVVQTGLLAQLTPGPRQLRAEFEELVAKELLGPRAGPEEEVTEGHLQDRYLIGMLAPKNRLNRALLAEVAAEWARCAENLSGSEVAVALEAAALQERQLREMSSVEVVWTGPTAASAGLRSTEQVILDLIRSARQSIWIVTFAAYKVGSLVTALRDAVARGVRVAFVLEDKDESGGKLSLSALPAFTGDGLDAAMVYGWPLEHRPRNDRGDHGALHAKCVLVDSQRLFVSSANMTEYALTLNIELGVLLNGGDAPRLVERNLTELIRMGVLRELAGRA